MPDSSPLSPQAVQQVTEAFKLFRTRLQTIAEEHRTTIKTLLSSVDAKHVSDIKDRIQQS